MKNIAIQPFESQEESSQASSESFKDHIPSGTEFFEMLEQQIRDFAQITIIHTIQDEFEQFIGVSSYKRSKDRIDYRNGVRYRDFETRFGPIEGIPISRARRGHFLPSLFMRWIRREKKITRAIADLFINGVSTRKVKNITKAIWGREYSASTVSRCNRVLQEDYLKWMNRPITNSIRYLFFDAVNLKVRRHWISKEVLLCAIGITDAGKKEFLGFLLGGIESTKSWETLLLQLLSRGLSVKNLKLVTVDDSAGLLRAIETLLSDVDV